MSLHYRAGTGVNGLKFNLSGFRATNGNNRKGYRPTIPNGVAQAVRTNLRAHVPKVGSKSHERAMRVRCVR